MLFINFSSDEKALLTDPNERIVCHGSGQHSVIELV
jgi:hypothetical protein